MQQQYPLNILKSLQVTVFLLVRKTGHGQQMTHIHFEVSLSNVKVTVALVAFYAKTMYTQYL